ncbi:IMP dehydrogenase [Actinoplanes sp. SE50]|uniref:alcohol dehydrogenase catalytic domain-containing protein n=1 Tax=unclassified Actinoplanes TaxID=2626549 RepID=UPI00023EBB92|nr:MULTISPECIES: alcohol dehydrogenase catalytic domain-containing protein [unclassified Actinoplanes]AEV84499.1 alcohol dehydrogenase [Actinoplanes sp. SE50/110]ATO82891.1 IMP dehydrogenase [Actinoplanes sp. SE50]SLM00299.1 IMP dehydrogenase [Actinoplanes sp. SE50/110]
MRATLMFGAGDVRVETVADPAPQRPTDAVVRVVRSCVCGSDLHPYHSMPAAEQGRQVGHEFLGIVEQTGADVATVKAGDLVVASFSYQDNTCEFCRAGVQTACAHPEAGFFAGAQAELVRVPLADGTLAKLPVPADSELLPSLLTLADVYGTGYHAAKKAQVTPGDTVAVIGDGAVGLLAVLSAKQLGAGQIVLMGRHKARTDLGVEFGATDVVAERGEEGIAKVRELTGGGALKVLEAVGHRPAYDQAVGIVRAGGVISRVGVPQYDEAPVGRASLFGRNITLNGGPAPVRAYVDELLPGILDGSVNPGKVFDRTVSIEEVPAAYRAMDDREVLKALIAF